MSKQKFFERFHRAIKVETEELREKRDILVDKVRSSLKKAGHPLPDLINQGSYIYGVGVIPVGNVEFDIDVGLDFPIKSADYEGKTVRKWVFEAVEDHTKNVEDRGPCIRVRYAAGYHVDLVVYARFKTTDAFENFQIARKDNSWRPAEPKKLKQHILDARKPFSESKDSSGSDQLQRVTRYLKRWNDVDTPDDSPDKPFGLATLLLVIEHLKFPVLSSNGDSDDLAALIKVANAVDSTFGRVTIRKPTQEFEDVFGKISESGMGKLKNRFKALLSDLKKAQQEGDEEKAATLLRKHFGDDFPDSLKKSEDSVSETSQSRLADMNAALPNFTNPSRPWCKI